MKKRGTKPNKARNDELQRLRREGWGLKELAAHFGISTARAWAISNWDYYGAKRKRAYQARRAQTQM